MDLSRERFLIDERRRAEESRRLLGSIFPALHAVIRTIEELLVKLERGDRSFPVDVEHRYELWLKGEMEGIGAHRTGAA
jgi:hypothetical protein